MIPAGGFIARDNYSNVSIQWLEWGAKQRGIRIRHALNEGEVRFPSPLGGYYRLDGYYRDPTSGQQLGFEYKYCVSHGCYCIDRDVQDPYDKHTMTGRYAQTAEKVRILEAARIKVITK